MRHTIVARCSYDHGLWLTTGCCWKFAVTNPPSLRKEVASESSSHYRYFYGEVHILRRSGPRSTRPYMINVALIQMS